MERARRTCAGAAAAPHRVTVRPSILLICRSTEVEDPDPRSIALSQNSRTPQPTARPDLPRSRERRAFRLVIFDLDGTLIDSAGDLHEAVNRMLGDLGCAPLPLAEVRTMIGDGASMLIARALAARHCSAAQGSALQLFLRHYSQQPATLTKLYPGARAVLETLSAQGVKLALCTNKPANLTRVVLETFDLERYFARVIGGDTLPFRKPDPRTLTELLTGFEVAATDSLLVGDSEVDAATAQAAAVPFALMTHGYHRGAIEKIPSLAAFDTFSELLEFL
jgi:phosphoglycolate phosphatase